MGLMCSWIAVKTSRPSDLFEELQLAPTGEVVEPWSRQEPISYRSLPNGWIVVYANDFEWATAERLRGLSRLGRAVACQIDEKVRGYSTAAEAIDGEELWRLSPEPDSTGEPSHQLRAVGAPPVAPPSVVGSEPGDPFEAPIHAAQVVCGFNLYEIDDAEVDFIGLRPIGPNASVITAEPRSAVSFFGMAVIAWLKAIMFVVERLDNRVFVHFPKSVRSALNFVSFAVVVGFGLSLPALPITLGIQLVDRLLPEVLKAALAVAMVAVVWGVLVWSAIRRLKRRAKPQS